MLLALIRQTIDVEYRKPLQYLPQPACHQQNGHLSSDRLPCRKPIRQPLQRIVAGQKTTLGVDLIGRQIQGVFVFAVSILHFSLFIGLPYPRDGSDLDYLCTSLSQLKVCHN